MPPSSATLSVLLPLPLSGAYDYAAAAALELAPGDFVAVPLGRRRVAGVVWGGGTGEIAPEKLKAVAARIAAPPLPEVSRRFIEWVASYTLSPLGAVLKMAMSVPPALEPPKRKPRAAVPFEMPDGARPGPALSVDQQAGADTLVARLAEGTFSATLLDGVPGSGKTEVYFEAVAAAIRAGRQVLVLLPEIALSAQWLDRFKARFGAAPAVWHSEITSARRRQTWKAVADGIVPVVVGARSALFLPFADLGLIIVDEEHDSSFKQEEGVIYHARDMAVVRARLGDIPVVLASATPSLETVINAQAGRYGKIHLALRHAGAILPAIGLIDMRKAGISRQNFLSPALKTALTETLSAGEQAMLFLNRRGYAPLTLCRTCGFRLQCPSCTAWLVEHRLQGRLICHHCGHAVRTPSACPSCAAEGSLAACGPGVERVAEEAAAAFPDRRIEVMASDTIAGPQAAASLIQRMGDHDIDILIGTQIVAKGHHFPMLTLVGVVDADLGLAGGDLRAAERCFQLLYQVAGRAGRSLRPGRVLLQTFMPEHPVLQALATGDRARFLEQEEQARRDAAMPPFGRLAALIVSGRDEARVERYASSLARTAPQEGAVTVLGPAPAPFALLRGRHRRRLLVKAAKGVNLQALLRRWLPAVPEEPGVRLQIDIDPYSFL